MNSDEYEQSSIVCSETEFPRNCGFCKHKFDTRQDRIDHIADHFKQGKCMLDWNDDSNDDSNDSDNNDDDDDKPNGDGYDGAPSHPPPESDPRDEFGSKYYGGGDYGGGSSSSSSGGGGNGSGSLLLPDNFFQFQLSSKPENVEITRQGKAHHDQQRSSSTPEPGKSDSLPELLPWSDARPLGSRNRRRDMSKLVGTENLSRAGFVGVLNSPRNLSWLAEFV